MFSISHEVLINGEKLPAGKYGLFMIPRKNKWTIIFSKEFRSWGAYAYDKKEDALRINVKPESDTHSQWLNYEFIEKENDKATIVMKWDTMKIPFQITVPNAKELYVESIRIDLKYGARWESASLIKAVDFCIENKINLEEALIWANRAIDYGFNGQKTFRNYSSKSEVLRLLGREKESNETFKEALKMLPPNAEAVYWEGRMLIYKGLNDKAVQLFLFNKKKFPKQIFNTNLGLAHGYKALNNDEKTKKYLKLAIKHLPKEKVNTRDFYINWLEQLENK